MKEKSKKYILTIIISAVGLLGGFLYWRFIGCKTGTCPMTSNWYTSAFTGGLIGYLAGDSVNDLLQKRKKQ